MAARSVFAGTDITLVATEKDYPEIQANTSLEIARYTSNEAARELQLPAMREDHSLCLNGLKQTPGPFMNYFGGRLNEDDIIGLYKNIADRSGYFEVATVLAFPDGKMMESVFRVNFTFAEKPRGDLQNGWNRIIVLQGEKRTLAEYPETERVSIWSQGYREILRKISTKSFQE